MDGVHDLLILMRAGDGQHIGEARADRLGLVAHAAGHDHPAIFGHGLANGGQRFFLGRSRKPQVFTSTTSAPA
jgi:hypothetical protein